MVLLKEYESLSDVLIHIKKQIIDSLDYAEKTVPKFAEPESLFYWLKDRIIYREDPATIELIMSMETMMNGSRTGTRGAGDCDDFTITGIASCYANGWHDIKIALAGRQADAPVHIYFLVNFGGEWFSFDLTNKQFNHQRPYKFRQLLDFRI